MTFSVIMPSYLGDYVHGAKHRALKFRRAVESVIMQTITDWELVIVADGCDRTVLEAESYKDSRIRVIKIDKQEWQSAGFKSRIGVGKVRNEGLAVATGDWVVYLDTDDFLGCNHLKHIAKNADAHDWVWWNDHKWNPVSRSWSLSENSISRSFHCGTANIAHKRELGVKWPEVCKYGMDDLLFINELKKFKSHTKITGGQYFICHVPKNPMFQSYDI